MKRTKIQEAIDHIAGVRRGAKLHNDAYMIRVCTTALEALCEKREREKNPPLTLDELRGMDGEPVWCCNPQYHRDGHWAIIRYDQADGPEYNYCAYAVGIIWPLSEYGKTWLAYRRKPEELS